jgi:hypothetical protein
MKEDAEKRCNYRQMEEARRAVEILGKRGMANVKDAKQGAEETIEETTE